MVQNTTFGQNPNCVRMNEGLRRSSEVQKLFDKGGHREAKPGRKMLSGKKHRVVFST